MNGDNCNLNLNGGDNTYGVERSIEDMQKEEGHIERKDRMWVCRRKKASGIQTSLGEVKESNKLERNNTSHWLEVNDITTIILILFWEPRPGLQNAFHWDHVSQCSPEIYRHLPAMSPV